MLTPTNTDRDQLLTQCAQWLEERAAVTAAYEQKREQQAGRATRRCRRGYLSRRRDGYP